MSGPFRKTVSLISNTFSPGSERNEILSIELSFDGFSFAILDARDFKYLVLESYNFEEKLNTKTLADQVELLVKEHPLLLGSFEKVNISWYHPHFTLVPVSLFLHAGKQEYHKFSGPVLPGHEYKTDKLNNLQAYGIYPIPDTLIKKLGFLFHGHKLRHSGTVLIESLLADLKLGVSITDCFIHIRHGHFELLLFEKFRLSYYHAFAISSIEDLMYYLFYVLEQFGLDASNMQAMLAGEISLDSKNYKQLATYFKKLSFMGRSDIYQYGPEFDEVPHHYFFNLLNLNSCG